MFDRSAVIASACGALSNGDLDRAAEIIRIEYPSTPVQSAARRITKLEAMRVFMRDGFVDRYSGRRLVFPGALRLLSYRMPAEFPFHKNWKTDKCHPAFYELCPTIDHEVPVTRGGVDAHCNWVTTSMSRNLAKSNFLLSEIGWIKHDAIDRWDGLTSWFLAEFVPESDQYWGSYMKQWKSAAELALQEVPK
jgi:hypothetical protein